MSEKELKGEPAEHESEEVEDIDKIPDDIVLEKEEEIEERKKVEERKKGMREMLQRIEDVIAPRFEVKELKKVDISEEKVQKQVEEDLKNVDEALQKETGDVDELKVKLEQMKKAYVEAKEKIEK